LRSRKILPLPGVSTLLRFFKDFQIQPGFLESVAKLVRVKVASMTELEKVATASFDEVHLKSGLAYDRKYDQVVGPHREANVLMLRGIFAKWKLPIWYDYDCKLTKEMLLEIINKVSSLGLDVVASVCDQGGKNRGLATSLDISKSNCEYAHPANPDEKICWFYDAPHILKNLRGALLNYGFVLPSGTYVGKKHLEKLLAELPPGMSMAYKLTKSHLNVEGQDAQTVRTAAQLLSTSTALAIKYIFPDDAEMLELAEFIQLVDNWFDCMNSRHKFDKAKPHRSGFRLHFEKQKKTIEEAIRVFTALQVRGIRTRYMPWQDGLIISSKSILCLYDRLKTKLGISWLLTCKFNQDCCENLFSRLRCMRGHALSFHALEFQYRLREHILGGCADIAVKSASVDCPEDDDVMLTSDVSLEFVTEDPVTAAEAAAETAAEAAAEESSAEVSTPTNEESEESIIEDFDDVLLEFSTEALSVSQEQGLIYIGGYLARTCGADEHYRTINDDKDPNQFVASGWLDDKNTAGAAGGVGLYYPSKILTSDLHAMEKQFISFHEGAPNGLRRDPKVVHTLKNLLHDKFSQYPLEMLRKFSMVRTMIRMREINREIAQKNKVTQRGKRKKGEFAY
jgi:hypothetical protein